MIDNFIAVVQKIHWAVLFFLGGMILQLGLLVIMAISSYWAHVLVVFILCLWLGLPVLILVALIIELVKKRAEEESQVSTVGLVFVLSLLTLGFILIWAGPLVNDEFVGNTHFQGQLYYLSGKSAGGETYEFSLYECHRSGFNCRSLGVIARGSSKAFDFEVTGEHLQILYQGEPVYTALD
jgi:hypothetical protein